jgi:hypothetical protein
MKRAERGAAHYEVELRQPDPGDGRTGTSWRPIRRVGPDGAMAPLEFSSLEAARAHAGSRRQEARIVAVEENGWRRTVDAGET